MDILQNSNHLSIKEASKITKMSQSWFRKSIMNKSIKHLKIGSRVFIPTETIKKLLTKGIVEPIN